LEDPSAGLLKTAESDMQTQITNIGNQITTKQNQVDQLQTTLTNQMAAADAMISSMEQQYSYLTSMFQAQQTADQLYK
jgi:flagellar capping protein FliD